MSCARASALGGAAAHHDREAILQLGLCEQVAVLGRQLLRDGERGDAARDDRDAVDRIGVFARERDERMAELVVGDPAALGGRDDPRPPFEAHRDPVDRLLELRHPDRLAPAPGGEQARFVDHVGQLCPGEAGRARSNDVEREDRDDKRDDALSRP